MSPLLAAAESDFDPQHEFLLEEWIPIHLGPLDLSVNKAVVYVWLGGIAKHLDQTGISQRVAGMPLAEIRAGAPA